MANFNPDPWPEGETQSWELTLFDEDGDLENALEYFSSSQTVNGTGQGIVGVIRHGPDSDADQAGTMNFPFVDDNPTFRQNSEAKARDDGQIVATIPDLDSGKYWYSLRGTKSDGTERVFGYGELQVLEVA